MDVKNNFYQIKISKIIIKFFIFISFILGLQIGFAQKNVSSNKSKSSKQNEIVIQLKKEKLIINKKILNVEVADTPESTERGLMYRKTIGENDGMLFVFPSEEYRSFWMKNTFIDLSIAYINKNKIIIDIQDMIAVKSELQTNLPLYQSRYPAQYALEMRLGWFKKNNIKVGDKIEYFNKK